MASLSVCMMVQNVEKLLPIALNSLNYVYDKLIIVDGGSTDLTCEIALDYNATVVDSKWSGNHSGQRNIYLDKIKTDWVFVLDSDEFIDVETLNFLRSLKEFDAEISTDNYWLPRKWISDAKIDRYITSTPHSPDFQRRLFRYNPSLNYSGLIHETLNGLKDKGQILSNLSIDHLDLYANDSETRRNKIRKYSQIDPRNGAKHFYMPSEKLLTFGNIDLNTLNLEVRELVSVLPNKNYKSPIDDLISPEIKYDNFYDVIYQLSKFEDIKTVLEIGSSSGGVSTEAFVNGLRDNPNEPTLFCMEVSRGRFAELKKRYIKDKFVNCYNVSSIAVEDFPDRLEVIKFYEDSDNNLRRFPLDIVLSWLQQDIDYVNNAGLSANGIKIIKEENNIDVFDLVLIDGSEFTGIAELKEVYGSNFIR